MNIQGQQGRGPNCAASCCTISESPGQNIVAVFWSFYNRFYFNGIAIVQQAAGQLHDSLNSHSPCALVCPTHDRVKCRQFIQRLAAQFQGLQGRPSQCGAHCLNHHKFNYLEFVQQLLRDLWFTLQSMSLRLERSNCPASCWTISPWALIHWENGYVITGDKREILQQQLQKMTRRAQERAFQGGCVYEDCHTRCARKSLAMQWLGFGQRLLAKLTPEHQPILTSRDESNCPTGCWTISLLDEISHKFRNSQIWSHVAIAQQLLLNLETSRSHRPIAQQLLRNFHSVEVTRSFSQKDQP